MNKYDLEKRTLEFSIKLIETLKKLPKNLYNYKSIGQRVGSGTSIGANYREANGAESRKDFKHKIRISYKESRETRYWLEVLMGTNKDQDYGLDLLWNEVNQFVKIFASIVKTAKQNEN